MNVNLDLLKEKYLDYKIEKGEKPENSEAVNIYDAEFKTFLVDEMGADSSIFQKGMDEILNMSIEDGKLIDNSKNNQNNSDNSMILQALDEAQAQTQTNSSSSDDVSSDGEVVIMKSGTTSNNAMMNKAESSSDEAGFDDGSSSASNAATEGSENENSGFSDGTSSDGTSSDGGFSDETSSNETKTDTPEENSNKINSKLQKKLDKVYNNKTAQKYLDTDGDGKISDEEKQKFMDYIKAYGGDINELDEEDIKLAMQDMVDEKFSYDRDLSDIKNDTKTDDTKTDKADKEEKEDKTDSSSGSSGASGASGGGGVSGGGGSGGVSGGSGASSTTDSNVNLSDSETIDEKIAKLQEEQNTVKTDLDGARDDLKEVYSGENEAVKTAQDKTDDSEKDLEKALEEDKDLSDEEKEAVKESVENIKTAQEGMDETKTSMADKDSQIASAQNEVSAAQATVDGLNAALASYDTSSIKDEKRKAEVEAQKAEVESQLKDAEAALDEKEQQVKSLEEEKNELEKTLEEKQQAYDKAMEASQKLVEDLEKKSSNSAKAVAKALDSFNENTQAVEETKTKESETIQKTIDDNQTKYDDYQKQIDELQAQKVEEENKQTGSWTDDLGLTDDLTAEQQAELESVLNLFKNNQATYEDVAKKFQEQTGVAMPPELICAIHYRESSGNFNTYLHNGEPLGQVTTLVPEGIYFDNFTDAAVDALVREYSGYQSQAQKDGVASDFSTMSSICEYAEVYNGLGYRDRGCKSAYVYSGTSAYTGGMYVADRVFSSTTKDPRVGVAAIIKKLSQAS